MFTVRTSEFFATTMYTSTLLSRSPTSLLALLSSLSKLHADHSLLFALSASSTVRAQDLSALVSRLNTFSRHTIGCLSAPLPGHYRNYISCSLAVFDPAEAVLFRSTIPGRVVPQVGRWHAFRKKEGDKRDAQRGFDDVPDNWGEVWDRSAGEKKLPVELQGLKSDFAISSRVHDIKLPVYSPDDVHEIVYLSDLAPEGLTSSLGVFKHATKVRLVCPSASTIRE